MVSFSTQAPTRSRTDRILLDRAERTAAISTSTKGRCVCGGWYKREQEHKQEQEYKHERGHRLEYEYAYEYAYAYAYRQECGCVR